jgi:DNA-binding NtrC family response regulator
MTNHNHDHDHDELDDRKVCSQCGARLATEAEPDQPEPGAGSADPTTRLLESAAESRLSLQELGERYTQEVLRRCGGNKVHAAAILKIDRKTLYRRAERRARAEAAARGAGDPAP